MLRPYGRKEVTEAVLISALTTLATQLITWGVEVMKGKKKEEKKDADKP